MSRSIQTYPRPANMIGEECGDYNYMTSIYASLSLITIASFCYYLRNTYWSYFKAAAYYSKWIIE
jgi:hypothetical protein